MRADFPSSQGTLFVAGVSFKTAPVGLRERLAVAQSDREAMARRLKEVGRLEEMVLLWTCNRVEIYGVSQTVNGNVEDMFERLSNMPLRVGDEIYCHQEDRAVTHLFSVASGMDSMVLGETEITRQVKTAYEDARVAGYTGKRTNVLFQKALNTAKRIRTSTAIGSGAASVGSVAVQHAQRVFHSDLSGRKVMVIGAGAMAEKCLRHLVKQGASDLVVVNRSIDKAEALAENYGGVAVSFGRCLEAMVDVDIVITSTGCPHILLERQDVETVMAHRPDRPLVIVDIAVPRDVAEDAGAVPGVHLHDIGHLEETVRENIRYREQDLAQCWDIIRTKAAALAPRQEALAHV